MHTCGIFIAELLKEVGLTIHQQKNSLADVLEDVGGYRNVKESPELLKYFLNKLGYNKEFFEIYENELTQMLDGIFGLPGNVWESQHTARRRYPQHQDEAIRHAPTQYSKIQAMIDAVKPNKNDVFYDLGCGYGRVVLYTALVTDAKCVGIELVEERVHKGENAAKVLGIEKAKFLKGCVLDHNFSEGNIFFLFNPFNAKTLVSVVRQLKNIAEKKRITIATWGGREIFFTNRSWLEIKTKIPIAHGPMYILESI